MMVKEKPRKALMAFTTKNPGLQPWVFWSQNETRLYRSSSPSSHLQMKYATTLAIMEIKKETKALMTVTSFLPEGIAVSIFYNNTHRFSIEICTLKNSKKKSLEIGLSLYFLTINKEWY